MIRWVNGTITFSCCAKHQFNLKPTILVDKRTIPVTITSVEISQGVEDIASALLDSDMGPAKLMRSVFRNILFRAKLETGSKYYSVDPQTNLWREYDTQLLVDRLHNELRCKVNTCLNYYNQLAQSKEQAIESAPVDESVILIVQSDSEAQSEALANGPSDAKELKVIQYKIKELLKKHKQFGNQKPLGSILSLMLKCDEFDGTRISPIQYDTLCIPLQECSS